MKNVRYKIVAWLAALFIVVLIAGYVIEFEHIGNTIRFEGLLWRSFAVALLAGIWLGWRYQHQGEEQVDRIRIWSAALLLPLFFAPWLGSLTNRMIPKGNITYKSFEFVEEKPFPGTTHGFLKGKEQEVDGCYLFVYYEGEIHRLKRQSCKYSNNQNGDVINLPVRKGLWGYEIVKQDPE